MTQAVARGTSRSLKRGSGLHMDAVAARLQDMLSLAGKQGLLDGGRTLTVRGRMPSLLVERAKKKTGIMSDSKLLEAALVNLAVEDDYGDWLLAQRGTISKELDLEF